MAKCPLADGFLTRFREVAGSPAGREALMRDIREVMDRSYRNANTRATYFTEIRTMLTAAGATPAELNHLTLTPEDYERRAAAGDRRLGLRQLSAFRLTLHPRAFLESAMRAMASKDPITRLLGVQALTGRRSIEIFTRGSIEADSKYPGWAWFHGQAKAVDGAPPFLIPLLHPGGFPAVHNAWMSARRDLARDGIEESGPASSRLQQVALAAVPGVFGAPFTSTHLLRSAAAAFSYHWLNPPMTKLNWFGLILGHRVQRGGELVIDRQTPEAYEKWDIKEDGELPPPIALPHLSVLLPHLIAPPDSDEDLAAANPNSEPHTEPEVMPSKSKQQRSKASKPQPKKTPPAPKKRPKPARTKAPAKPSVATPAAGRTSTNEPVAPINLASDFSKALAAMREAAAGKRKQAAALVAEAEAIEQRVVNAESLARQLQDVVQGLAGVATTPSGSSAGSSQTAAPAAGPPDATAVAPLRPVVAASVSARPAPILELAKRVLSNGAMERGALFEAMVKAQELAGEKPMARTAFDMFVSRQTRGGILVKTGVGKNQSLALAQSGPTDSTNAAASPSKTAGVVDFKKPQSAASRKPNEEGERPF